MTSVTVENVWKIFGVRAAEVLEAARRGDVDKTQALEQYNCVIGVADVSFHAEPGEIFCIMGLSGSGKSTLVRHINRLLEPTAGAVRIGGDDITAMDEKALRDLRNRRVGMVFQSFGLMPHRTVRENAALPLEIRGLSRAAQRDAAEEALTAVGLDGWGDKYADELSGGMQQRVGLARAIVADPEIMLMDEPFSALDPLIRRQLQNQFLQLARAMGKTTLFITHDLDEAIRIGRRIAIMRDGRIVQTGCPADIVLRPANEYVADFVAGMSRMKFITASAVMKPTKEWTATNGTPPENAPTVSENDNLDVLIRRSLDGSGVIRVQNGTETVGVVDRQMILRALCADEKPTDNERRY